MFICHEDCRGDEVDAGDGDSCGRGRDNCVPRNMDAGVTERHTERPCVRNEAGAALSTNAMVGVGMRARAVQLNCTQEYWNRSEERHLFACSGVLAMVERGTRDWDENDLAFSDCPTLRIIDP